MFPGEIRRVKIIGGVVNNSKDLLVILCWIILSIASGLVLAQDALESVAHPDLFVSDNFSEKIDANTKISVIVDACITQDDYFSVEESEFFRDSLAKYAAPFLLKSRYNIEVRELPIVCAMLSPGEAVTFKDKGGNIIEKKAPPYVSKTSVSAEELVALNAIFSGTHKIVASNAHKKMEHKLANIMNNDEFDDFANTKTETQPALVKYEYKNYIAKEMSTISQSSDSKYTLVLVGDGTLVSPGIASMNTSSGIMIGAAFGGAVFAVVGSAGIDAHYFVSAAMYENSTGELLWKNLGQIPVLDFSPNVYIQMIWPLTALALLPEQPIEIDEEDGLSAPELRQLIAGNTLAGELNSGKKFLAYFNRAGKVFSEELDATKFEGLWRVNEDAELCLHFNKEHCGIFSVLGDGKYKLFEKSSYAGVVTGVKTGNFTSFK